MNRRNFLSLLAASFTLDPERILWKPGAKLISIPSGTLIKVSPVLDEINAITLEHTYKTMVEDLFYARYPFRGNWSNGGNYIADSFLYSTPKG